MGQITPSLIDFYDTLNTIFEENYESSPVSIYNPSDTLLITSEIKEQLGMPENEYFVFIDLDEFPKFMHQYNKYNFKAHYTKIYSELSKYLIEFINNSLLDMNKYYTFLNYNIIFMKVSDNFIHDRKMLKHISFHKIK